MRDYIPISLITSPYKFIDKVLAERLKRVLFSTISDCQVAFVQGRPILDAILVATEAVEDYRSRKKKDFLFKLDLEKAYDMVN